MDASVVATAALPDAATAANPALTSTTAVTHSETSQQAADETEEEYYSDDPENFPDPYEAGIYEEYNAFRVNDGPEEEDDDDEEETPLVSLKLPKLTDPDKFARALENAEDLPYEQHFRILEHAQQALVAWQDEFMRLDRYIAKRETGEDKDGVPVVRNPRALRYTGQTYQDRLEADVYGYEHNPHPSKIGAQDPIKQRVLEGRPSRALRDRINPTKKLVEGDDTTTPDDEDTPGASNSFDDNFHEPELSNSGRPLRMRNMSRQASLSRDSTPVATFPSGKRIGRPPKKLARREEIQSDARAEGFTILPPDTRILPPIQPKRRGGRPSKKELENRAAARAAELQLQAEADDDDARNDETRSNTADTTDRFQPRSTDPAQSGKKILPGSALDEPLVKKHKGGRPRKDALIASAAAAETETSETEQPEDKSQRLSKGQKASWAKDGGGRRLAQSLRMKEKWDRVKQADPNAKSLAGSKSKPEPPAILPPTLSPAPDQLKKGKGGRPKKVASEETPTTTPIKLGNHLIKDLSTVKRKRKSSIGGSSDGPAEDGPLAKKAKGGRVKMENEETPAAPLYGVITPDGVSTVTNDVTKAKGRAKKTVLDSSKGKGKEAEDEYEAGAAVIIPQGDDAPNDEAAETLSVKAKARGGRPKKNSISGPSDIMSTPQAAQDRMVSRDETGQMDYILAEPGDDDEDDASFEDEDDSPEDRNGPGKSVGRKSKSEKMKAIMKARWKNGEMDKVMEKKKANAAARRKAAGEPPLKKGKPGPKPKTPVVDTPVSAPATAKVHRRRTIEVPGDGSTPGSVDTQIARQLGSIGRKLSEYEEFQALSSPAHSPLGRRGRRTAAVRASASFSKMEDDDDVEEDKDSDEDAEADTTPDSEAIVPPRSRHTREKQAEPRSRQSVQIEDSDDAPTRQLGTEYDQFQAVSTPGSTVVLGKRKRKPVVNLEEAMKIEAESEDEDEYDDDMEE